MSTGRRDFKLISSHERSNKKGDGERIMDRTAGETKEKTKETVAGRAFEESTDRTSGKTADRTYGSMETAPIITAKNDKKRVQMSEAFINCAFLAMSGGFQDAYTYYTRNKVFSNAQTGNVVLMSHHIMMGEWADGLRYLLPLLAFIGGVLAAENVQNRYKFAQKIHWRQSILLAEIVILFAVGFMGQPLNMAATALVSFACAMQVQSFCKVGGFPYASTMCIGNLRSGTAALSLYMRERKRSQLKQAVYYFGIIFFFAVGAGIGGRFSMMFGIHAIWMSCGFLLVSIILMAYEKIR